MILSRTRLSLFFAFLVLALWANPLAAADPPAPTFVNVSYGPHERNVLDLWQAKSERPTPLVVFIHGGGFVNGDKSHIHRNPAVRQCLDAGVSMATINYRFRNHAPIQDILRDAARAIQYIRSRAREWNIDPDRIAAYGGSAGAGTSMWLAFHDDLADPDSADPVLRQSSRLAAAGSLNGQGSYDVREWESFLGQATYEPAQGDGLGFYGFATKADSETPEADRIMKDCSMIGLVSKDDPPVVVACDLPGGDFKDRGHYVHHPKHSIAIAERCKENGVECLLLLRDESQDQPAKRQQAVVAFLIEKLKSAAPTKPAESTGTATK
jgi:acetyl esterase/lipase